MHLEELEGKVSLLEGASNATNHENSALSTQVQRLQVELRDYRRRLLLKDIGREETAGLSAEDSKDSEALVETLELSLHQSSAIGANTETHQLIPELEAASPASGSASSDSVTTIDSSSEDESLLESYKRRIIERVMVDFYKLFGESSGIRKAYSSGQRKTSPQEPVSFAGGLSRTQEKLDRTRKRKPTDDEDDEEEKDGSKRRRTAGNTKVPDVCDRRLACPYFKRNPKKYRDFHPCLGPGWNSMHRLK